MSAIIYYSARDAEDADEPLIDMIDVNCQLKIVCYNSPVGLATGDANEPDRWYPLAVIHNESEDSDIKPVLACEDCAGWLAEALGGKVE